MTGRPPTPALGGASPGADTVAGRLALVRRRIAEAGGDPESVRVVAVTKGFGLPAVEAALGAGLTDLGENYASELVGKAAALAASSESAALAPSSGAGVPPPVWHFLGAVQRRKVPGLAPVVGCWQGVARPVEAEAIARHRPGARVLVQVDVTGAPGRNGCPPSEVPGLVKVARDLGLDVLGLMTVAPTEPSAAGRAFDVVRDLADRLGLPERSMGMSGDLELAVAAGSTMVRVGRALFGERPTIEGGAG